MERGYHAAYLSHQSMEGWVLSEIEQEFVHMRSGIVYESVVIRTIS